MQRLTARITIELSNDAPATDGPGIILRADTMNDLALQASTQVMETLLATAPPKRGTTKAVRTRFDPDDEPETLEPSNRRLRPVCAA